MSESRRKKRGAAGWCVANEIGPGDRIEVLLAIGWTLVTVTALGHSSILVHRKGRAEFVHWEPTKLRMVGAADRTQKGLAMLAATREALGDRS